MTQQHQQFMQRALTLARQANGLTSPNPMVGAVVVKDGRIVGEGYHQRAGSAHAEVKALSAAGAAAQGATLYVTLEPCNHYGRTPPCTQAIINAGIVEVVYAVRDPNPQAGGGHEALTWAGIAVQPGICEADAYNLNRFFFHHADTGRPYVIAKFAVSLDGKIATRTGQSQWITGESARRKGHELRQAVDAILVGTGTAIMDNPSLTTRLPDIQVSHPLRIVLDSRGRTPLQSRLFSPDLPGQTLVATTAAMPPARHQALQGQGVWVWELPATPLNGRVNIKALLDKLGQQQVQSVLVEGGGSVLGSFFDEGLVQEVWAFLSPMVIGGQAAPGPVAGCGSPSLQAAWHLKNSVVEQIAGDYVIRGLVN